MQIYFSVYDYIIFFLYFAASIYIGLKTKPADNSNAEYLVAGRRLTLPIFVATLVSTFYGGILGVGEFTYNVGISSWLLNAFPYYFFITIFAFFLAGKIRKTNLFTIPDKLENAYGKKVSLIGAFLLFLLITPAPYLLMAGILIQLFTGFSLVISLIIGLLFSVIYLFKGGLNADVRVNVFEFVIMYLGFGIILPFCFSKLGGLSYVMNNLPETHLSLSGGNSLQYIMVWFFIGAWAIVDPSFHQRCYAAENAATPKKGILISLAFWFIFDLMTITTGLYARAFMPGLENPSMAYPLFADAILPPIAKGLFFIGMFATVTSTLHSYIFVSATTIGNDILAKVRKVNDTGSNLSKTGLVITSIVSLGIIVWVPSIVGIWYTIGSLTIPALLLAVVTSYSLRMHINRSILASAMAASFLVSLVSLIYGQINMIDGNANYLFDIEPMYPGLVMGVVIYFCGLGIRKLNDEK
ncbi:sodium:solute symporter [soil metagenome]